jgi:hypothetical protein
MLVLISGLRYWHKLSRNWNSGTSGGDGDVSPMGEGVFVVGFRFL